MCNIYVENPPLELGERIFITRAKNGFFLFPKQIV